MMIMKMSERKKKDKMDITMDERTTIMGGGGGGLLRVKQPEKLLKDPSFWPEELSFQGSATTTSTSPISVSRLPSLSSRIIWVHLQASICTEWAQSSMIIDPTGCLNHKFFIPGKNSLQDVLHGYHRMEKKNPKTIHRCILQRIRTKNRKSLLNCHVCDFSYPSYDLYFKHLMDMTCVKQKNEKKRPRPLHIPPHHNHHHNHHHHHPRRSQSDIVVSPSSSGEESSSLRYNYEHRTRLKRRFENNNGYDEENEGSEDAAEVEVVVHRSSGNPKFHFDEVLSSPTTNMSRLVLNENATTTTTTMTKTESEVEVIEEAPLNLTTGTNKRMQLPPLKEGSRDPMLTTTTGFDGTGGGGGEKRRFLKTSENGGWCEADDDEICCPHWAVKNLPPLSITENAADEAKLANLKVQTAELLVSVFGEDQLTERGYPEKDVLSILNSILTMSGVSVVKESETCTEVCSAANFLATSSSSLQFNFRLLRRKVNVAKKNVDKLREIVERFQSLQKLSSSSQRK